MDPMGYNSSYKYRRYRRDPPRYAQKPQKGFGWETDPFLFGASAFFSGVTTYVVLGMIPDTPYKN